MQHPLEAYCKQYKIPQYELAAQLGCSASRLSQVISGAKPGVELALKIKAITGISINPFSHKDAIGLRRLLDGCLA
jgi:hypothetical protein